MGRIVIPAFIISLLGPIRVSKGPSRCIGTAPLKPSEEHPEASSEQAVGVFPKERIMLIRILQKIFCIT